MAKKTYQIKISLKNSKPKIWRRIVVSSDIRLFDFHKIIQEQSDLRRYWPRMILFKYQNVLPESEIARLKIVGVFGAMKKCLKYLNNQTMRSMKVLSNVPNFRKYGY